MEKIPNNIEKTEPHAINLLELTESEKLNLKTKVQESDGLARIFIHPLSLITEPIHKEGQDRISTVFARTIMSKKSPPIIIMEDSELASSWSDIIKQVEDKLNNDLYIVSTINDYPYPVIPGEPEPIIRTKAERLKKENRDYVSRGFKNFVTILNEAGVRKVLIGGAKLEIIDGDLNRCVGNFINFMQHYSQADLKVSMGTAPLNRNDIKDSFPDLA